MKKALYVVVPIIVLALIVLSRLVREPNASERRAVESCREEVLNQLQAPGSAIFPEPPYEGSLALEHDELTNGYEWSGYVDAQNSSGALLRTDFTCAVDANGNAVAVLTSAH